MSKLVKVMARRERKDAGFTLIELLIVMIIVGILAAAAVPIYSAYVRRARASEAKATIGAIRTAEEAYYTEHNVYRGDGADINAATADFVNLPTDDLTLLGVTVDKNSWWKGTGVTFAIDIDGTTSLSISQMRAQAASDASADASIRGMVVTLDVSNGTWTITGD